MGDGAATAPAGSCCGAHQRSNLEQALFDSCVIRNYLLEEGGDVKSGTASDRAVEGNEGNALRTTSTGPVPLRRCRNRVISRSMTAIPRSGQQNSEGGRSTKHLDTGSKTLQPSRALLHRGALLGGSANPHGTRTHDGH